MKQLKCPIKFANPCDNASKYCDPDCAWCGSVDVGNGKKRQVCALTYIAIGSIADKDITYRDLSDESE